MKKKINLLYLSYLFVAAMAFSACSREDLKEFESTQNNPTTVGTGSIAGQVLKTNEQVVVPVSIKLSKPAAKAFEVALGVNQEAALKHIADGNLGSDYVAVAAESIMLPNAIKVNFGADSSKFEIKITRTEVEKYFGKNIVIGYKITEVGKGNNIDPTKTNGVIILNTVDLLVLDDIHYISFTNGAGKVLVAKNQTNYESASSGMSIPIGITLASFPGPTFTVNLATSTDTIAKLVQSGILPANTVALQAGQFSMPSKVQVASNARTANFNVDIPWSVISANVNKQLAIMVKMTSSSLHVINPAKSYTILLIDSENVIEVDVTNQGVFSVNKDNSGGPNAGEGSLKFIDRNYNSKWLVSSFVGDLQAKLVFSTPQKIGSYTLTSGNDASDRDPNAWHLEASNDGVNWITIDSRSAQVFGSRNLTRRFDIDLPKAYTHYRLNITSNVGSSLFQASEWRMIRIP